MTIDEFLNNIDLDWQWTNKPAKNLFHFKGIFANEKFELFVTKTKAENHTQYRFQFTDDEIHTRIKKLCPKFELYFLETCVK